METNPDFIENIVHKAVKIANLANAEPHTSTELVERRQKIGRFEVESINSQQFEKTRKITISLDGTKIFQAVLEPGWQKHPEKITLVKDIQEPRNWRDKFMKLPINLERDNDESR